ncbi:hypothetical protein WS86_02900 [Burkholderia savannae]|nr:hypothetical protein WS86_02900 [Burkholderia savannae]
MAFERGGLRRAGAAARDASHAGPVRWRIGGGEGARSCGRFRRRARACASVLGHRPGEIASDSARRRAGSRPRAECAGTRGRSRRRSCAMRPATRVASGAPPNRSRITAESQPNHSRRRTAHQYR